MSHIVKTVLLVLAATTMTEACNDAKSGGGIQGPGVFNPSNSLASKGQMKGIVIAVDQVQGTGNLRPVQLNVGVAISGDLPLGKKWTALGLQVRTQNALLHKTGNSDFDHTSGKSAAFMIDGANDVFAVANGKNYKVGHAVAASHGSTVLPTGDVRFELAVGDAAYDIKEGKNVSDARVWVSVANLALD